MNMDFGFPTVPAFPTKLWALVEDASTNDIICWDASGKSFHIVNQIRFAREICPQYFKHNNISSFIRQLNMYGFRKVLTTEALNIKTEKEELTFAHQYFQQGQEHLLENIKRKTPTQSQSVTSFSNKDASKILGEVSYLKNQLDSMTDTLENLRVENEVLWKEVVNLRQKHARQQQVVSKLVQFFISVVNKDHNPGSLKRKLPLMIKGPSSDEGLPVATVPKVTQKESLVNAKASLANLVPALEDVTTGKEVRPRVFYLKKNVASEEGKFGKDGKSKILYLKPNAISEQISSQNPEPLNASSESYQHSLEIDNLLNEIMPQNGNLINLGSPGTDTIKDGSISKDLEVMKPESRHFNPSIFRDFDKEEFSRNLKSTQNTLRNVCDLISGSQHDIEGTISDSQLDIDSEEFGVKRPRLINDFFDDGSRNHAEDILCLGDVMSESSTPYFQNFDDFILDI